MAPVRTRSVGKNGRDDDGEIIYVDVDSIVSIILAKNVARLTRYDNGRRLVPTNESGILLITIDHGVVRALVFSSVAALLKKIERPKQFVMVNRGLAINTHRVHGESNPGQKEKIVVMKVGGHLHHLLMSADGARRLHRTLGHL